MRSVIWLIIGFVLSSSCSIAFVYNEKIELSGTLDAKTSDELAQDSAKGSGDQAYTRILESDYGYSRLFSRYIGKADSGNSYSMNMDAYGVSHEISFLGGNISSSNLIKIDETSGVASYFNMIAHGTMDESLKNIQSDRNVRGDNLGGELANTHVDGKFSLSSTYTDTKTAQDDARQLSSELEEIDVDLKPTAESFEDQDLNATHMQEKLGTDLEAAIGDPDISPDQVSDLGEDDLVFGFGNATGGITLGDPRRGLELMNTAAFNESKSDKIFAFRIRPTQGPLQATRVPPVKLGSFPV